MVDVSKGVNPRSRRTRLSADLLGEHGEKVPSSSALPLSHSLGSPSSGGVSLPSRASPCLYESPTW